MSDARAALLACVLGGCSVLSDFDGYRFTDGTDASDAAQLADVGTDAPTFDGGTDAAQLADVGQVADVGTDAPTFDPLSPDCCGLGCAQCIGNTTNPRRCFTMARGWICAVDCGPTCDR